MRSIERHAFQCLGLPAPCGCRIAERGKSIRGLLAIATLAVTIAAAASCSAGDESRPAATSTGAVEVLGSISHPGRAWTEGLIVSEGVLWESVGGPTGSQIRGLDRGSGEVLWSVPNDDAFFAEGLVRAFGRTYVLSYKAGAVYLFGRGSPQRFEPFARYDGEGWGLTAVASYLVNSNGTSNLYYRDPETFQIAKVVPIAYGGQPVPRLNELEYDGTSLWVHEWQTSHVYRILEEDPSQTVRYTLPEEICPEGIPNGLAWDEELDAFFVTGQGCDRIWKIRFH